MGALDGKVAIITGAAGGIGSAAARRFIDEGARVFLVDRDESALKRLAEAFPPDRAVYFEADVADEAVVKAFVADAARRFGQVDIALLNAGIEGEIGRIEDVPVAMFDHVMAVNVRSVWLGLAALLPAMRASGGGSIIITSSVAGLRGSARLGAYSASKHAVVGLMKSAALEGAPDKVRVNTINPSATRTRMIESIDQSMRAAGRIGDSAARVPLARYAEPSEVVSLMLFLASDESSFCTGGTYLIDGGTMA
ncbi:glucose 1-dehydrogenase [Mesorhizobium sp. M7A.F.Ca.US.006.01.1.1]|uniref:SDR family NAD(P)-dependent oxidoreductase n=1 Tax=Mesorhizobium sp. M7A.F.Ca.US.006.01.1.1 TaxID=2496707 RepID=UPI000FCC75DB|nr:glucose 1-dehydrogenase [Mesorhizobium sp. M7A.F.Ca.US.006.01.1.1]RUZ77964.1 glucose 1-dehydrogenase [Mesorhizobium sp. M7A.F.Ca.US.006.01.1.1]